MQQMQTDAEVLQHEVDHLCESAEFDYANDKGPKYRDRILALVKRIDQLLSEESSLSKQQRVLLYFLKGKVYDILPEYSKQAEDALTRSMKLAPQDPDNLVTLGHILWKKKDILGAKQCFENAIEQNPKHVKALQYLSIVLRQVGEDIKNRQENIALSVNVAKQALMLDLKNSQSWYLMGNAFLSDYFANIKKNTDQLSQALKAFNQAEHFAVHHNPDLYYNRANLLCYFEDYQLAFNDYRRAVSIDPSLSIDKEAREKTKLKTIVSLLENKCNISQKKLTNIIKQIPTGFKRQPGLGQQEYKLCPLSELTSGPNLGVVLSCKALKAFTDQTCTPAGFVVIDSTGGVGVLSVYNCSEDIYEKIHDNTDIYVVDPVLRSVEVQVDGQDVRYLAVQVFEIHKMYVQDQRVTGVYSQSVAVNQTFEK